MRIGVVSTQTPLIVGGAERHARNLVAALEARGHEATEITLPFKWFPPEALVEHVMAAKLVDLDDLGVPLDLVIGLKFPAWLVRHRNKVFWILHQHRAAYDFWEAGTSELLREPDGAAVRALIREEDKRALGVKDARIYANSRNVSKRLARYLGIGSTPLYHPPPNHDRLRSGAYGDYLFAPSRVGPNKRQTLMIEALVHAPSVRLKIAGPPDAPHFLDELRDLADHLGVADRVEVLGPIPDTEMLRHYAECRGVVFVPVDEDLGYITLEAMIAERPVVTATDSGGPLEFLTDGVEGLVVEPEPRAVGAAFARLMDAPAEAERMGRAGAASYAAKDITWDRVVDTLTGRAAPPEAAAAVTAAEGAEPPPSARRPAAAGEDRGGAKEPTPIDPGARALIAEIQASARSAGERALSDARPEPEPASGSAATDRPAPAASFGAVPPPPRPEGLTPGDAAAIVRAYGIDAREAALARDPDEADALDRHAARALAALALAGAVPAAAVIDLGAPGPDPLHALLASRLSAPAILAVAPGAEPRTLVLGAEGHGEARLEIASGRLDAPLPAADASADLVFALSAIERLAVDPLGLLREAARVLRPGGRLVVATPNGAGHAALARLAGGHPATGARYGAPGAQAAQARLLTPRGLEAMTGAAGFTTETLTTADLTPAPVDPAAAALLAAHGTAAGLAGDTILYAGRRDARHESALHPPPALLYRGDPRALSGRVSLVDEDRASGIRRLRIENTSPLAWPLDGPGAVRLRLSWRGAEGAHPPIDRALPARLEPGASAEIALPLDPGRDTPGGRLVAELRSVGLGAFAPDRAGGTTRLALPCSEAAFLRLAR